MKEYLSSSNFSSTTESEYLFEALQASFEVINGSHIYDQSLILQSFLSTVKIHTSTLSNLRFQSPPLKFLSTTINFEGVTLLNTFMVSNNTSLIFVNLGTVVVQGLTHKNSNTELLTVLYSNITVDTLVFENVTD